MKFNKYISKAFSFFRHNSWLFTVVLFLIILGISFIVWWDCILKPELSEAKKEELSTSMEVDNYERSIKKIEETVQKIRERKEAFEQNGVDFSRERSLFKPDNYEQEQGSPSSERSEEEDNNSGSIKKVQ
ncbi:MAG: hypothetical protein ACOCUF_03860 [Patescibacteria group bacterium]